MLPLLTRKTQTQPLKLSTVSSPYPKRAKTITEPLPRLWISEHLSAFRLNGRSGSHLRNQNERIASVCDFYKEGDQIWVKCLGTDNRGKIRLSAKRVNQETGEDA